MKTQISLDGGCTWTEAPEGVRVRAEQEDCDTFDFNFTGEGMIVDQFAESMGGVCVATACYERDDFYNLAREQ